MEAGKKGAKRNKILMEGQKEAEKWKQQMKVRMVYKNRRKVILIALKRKRRWRTSVGVDHGRGKTRKKVMRLVEREETVRRKKKCKRRGGKRRNGVIEEQQE